MARAREVLDAVGLGDGHSRCRRNCPAASSSGWRSPGRWSTSRTCWSADEPTSAIDARTGQPIMELIRQVALQPDRVAVVVTHDARVFDFADRIVTLEDGRVATTSRSDPNSRLPRRVDVWEHTLRSQTMFRRWILPMIAVVLLGFGFAHAIYVQKPKPESPPPVPPPTTPFGDTVAGQGMVEPNNEASTTSAISIGSQLSGVVTKVAVRIGQTVTAGDLLFELDKRRQKPTCA